MCSTLTTHFIRVFSENLFDFSSAKNLAFLKAKLMGVLLDLKQPCFVLNQHSQLLLIYQYRSKDICPGERLRCLDKPISIRV
jgi:hypothetical protein